MVCRYDPYESSEFMETQGHFVADPAGPAARRFDLLTVINHEMAHALGFSIRYPLFNAHVAHGSDGTRRYQSARLDVPLSSAGTHVATGAYPYDAMTDLLSSAERRPISALDLLILSDAFGYDVLPPREHPLPEPTAVELFGLTATVIVAGRARLLRRISVGRRGLLAAAQRRSLMT